MLLVAHPELNIKSNSNKLFIKKRQSTKFWQIIQIRMENIVVEYQYYTNKISEVASYLAQHFRCIITFPYEMLVMVSHECHVHIIPENKKHENPQTDLYRAISSSQYKVSDKICVLTVTSDLTLYQAGYLEG